MATCPTILRSRVVAVLLGATSWTAAEYGLHRFAMHEMRGRGLPSVEHLEHHADVTYFSPTSKKIASAAATSAIAYPVVASRTSRRWSAAFTTGFIAMYFGFTSLTVIQPGETKVLQFLGRYVGTVRRPGLQLTTPFTSKRRVSVKVNNFETHELKVNDSDGNPVNIAAIIVWQVADTAKATFAVENSQHFVEVQAEAALRHVASTHPYDNAAPGEESLRGSTELVAMELAQEVAARVAIAGIEIVEARISSLAYAQEIAHAMLQRQQAAAVIAARSMIVEGAVGMVEQALRRLETDSVVQMSEERKAQMVANLLLVLCGDSRATPVINTNP